MGAQLPSEPITRKEKYLAKAAGQAVEVPEEPITREEAYLNAIAHGGGGGGTNNYNDLSNQPQINGNTLIGNKTASDLGLVAAEAGKGLSSNDYTNEDKAIVGGVTEALAGKQGALTAGDYISIDANNEITVNREIPSVSASYELKTTSTSDPEINTDVIKRVNGEIVWRENYNYQTVRDNPVTIDDVFVLSYSSEKWKYKLLVASDDHAAGYEQTWGWSALVDYTENFNLIDNTGKKLIIKEEMDTAINAIKDGQSINSFAGVETALAGKQDKTDNSLQTTDKTVVGAVNELKSGLINLADDVKLNTQDLTTPSRTKNLLNYDEWKKVNVIGGSGVFENNGITLTATADCYTGYNNTNFPINARIPISEGETITLSWQANNDLSGIQYIFPNGSVSGAVSKNNANGKSLSYTADPGVTYVTFRFGVGDAGNSIEYSNIQIEKGNTATPFAPYIPSVETRLDAVERGKISKFHSVSSFNTSGLAKWCKIATITVTHGSWLQQYFMVAYNGYAIVSVKLRSTATDDFNNDETKITRIAGTNVTFGIKISDDYLTADMYIKSSAVQSSRYSYTILSEGGDGNGITFIDPIITSLTDTDMTISN